MAIHGAQIREKTGLPLDPLVTASKWAWLLEARPELAELAMKYGQLCFGTVDTWLIANLTCGAVHATDTSNASRTALLNLQTLDWDDEMLGLFGVPRAVLPRILQSSGVFGFCAAIPELEGVPIVSAIGDSHAALVGHGQYGPGTVKTTYGTGSSLMTLTDGLATPVEMLALNGGLVGTREGVQFALEGNIANDWPPRCNGSESFWVWRIQPRIQRLWLRRYRMPGESCLFRLWWV